MNHKSSFCAFYYWLLLLPPLLFSDPILNKMGPHLKRNMLQCQNNQCVLHKDLNPILDVRLEVTDPDAVRDAGFHLRTINGSYATAYVRLSEITRLVCLPGVQRIRQAQACYLTLDQSMPEMGMESVRSGMDGTGFTGKDVIIGIVDTGIDWAHPDFMDSEGKTRILAIWDQTLDEPNGGYHIFTQTQIQEALDSGDYSRIGGKDSYGHGTHIAGIAAGNGRATGNKQPDRIYIGAAPEASLIIVKVSDGISMTDSQVEDGLSFIFQKANEYGLPCVVNLSLGRRAGSHDGRDPFELGLNNYLGEAGRAIVVAAGNDGGKRIHVQHEFNPFIDDTLTVKIRISGNNPSVSDQISFEGWIHHLAPVEITIRDPQGTEYGPIAPGALYLWPENGIFQIYVDNGSGGEYEYNGDKQILVQLMDGEQKDELMEGDWKILFHHGSDRLDLWLVDNSTSAEIISEVNLTTLLNEPAHALMAIAVGSYISRTGWPNLWNSSWKPEGLDLGSLSSSSSPGPSRTNSQDNHTRNKPEITAPGEYIVSSHSGWSTYWPGDQFMASDSVHRAWSGTSFAAPHVTGLIACMFEQEPDLTANIIKGKLLNTKKDVFTGSEIWNIHWGFGKTDAAAAMGMSSVDNHTESCGPDRFQRISIYPNPFNCMTTITVQLNQPFSMNDQNTKISVFDIKGRLIRSFGLPFSTNGITKLNWDGLDCFGRDVSSGVYFLSLHTPQKNLTKKMLLIR